MINALLTLEPKCLGNSMQLVEVAPVLYANGVKLDKPVGYRYVVCLRAHRNDKLGVVIEGAQLLDSPEIDADVYVSFAGLVVRPYVDRNGRLALTAAATGITRLPHRPDASASAASAGNAQAKP